jgi:hypothetical protein
MRPLNVWQTITKLSLIMLTENKKTNAQQHLPKSGGSVVKSSFVLRTNICGILTVFVLRIEKSAKLKPPERRARKTHNSVSTIQKCAMRIFVLNEQSSESLKHSSHYGIEKISFARIWMDKQSFCSF